MKIKKLFKKIYSIFAMTMIITAFIFLWFFINKSPDITPYLPKESILKKQIEEDIYKNIEKAISSIIHYSDFFITVVVDLSEEEITKESITYEPKEVLKNSSKKILSPIPKVNSLPGLIDKPFHNETLPGFPSYFDEFEIEKDDYITRGLFAKILSIAYQIPKDNKLLKNPPSFNDQDETEYEDSIEAMVNSDILKLYKTGDFKPNNFLTKATLITAIVRINFPTNNPYSKEVISKLPYQDIDQSFWAYDYIKIALENKLIKEDILFNPNEKVTLEEVITLIEKSPLKKDIFKYYKFPKKNIELFKTKSKTESNESDIYFNQEKELFTKPSTKINKISIRVMINESILNDDTITLDNIKNIINDIVILNEKRNDTLIVKSYKFTQMPLISKIYKWGHWNKVKVSLLISIIFILIILTTYYLINKYNKYQNKKSKFNKKNIESKAKLEKIHQEEELKTYLKLKENIINDAKNNTERFSLKLEKWLELMFKSSDYEKKPNEPYEKTSIVILVIDFEKPGLATEIIKHLNNYHIKNTLNSIENLSQINVEKVQVTLREFYNNFMTPDILFGGKTTSNDIIKKSFTDKEKQILLNLDSNEKFDFLNNIETKQLKEFIINENDAVAAFILNHCNETKILDITKNIEKNKLTSIISNLIHTKVLPTELRANYEFELKENLFIKDPDTNKKKRQIQKASTIFETLSEDIRNNIFNDINKKDPELLLSIQSEMFMFEDIKLLEDVDVQSLIFEIKDMEILSTALLNSEESLAEKIITNLSERFQIQYNNSHENLKKMDISEDKISFAQSKTVRTLRQLEKNGRIANLKETKRNKS